MKRLEDSSNICYSILQALREVSKYVVFSGPYLPVFSPNTGKYGPETTPYLDTFHAVKILGKQYFP